MGKLISKEFNGVRQIEDVDDDTRGIFDDGFGDSDYEDTESDTSVSDGEVDEEIDEESDEKVVELDDTVSYSWL
jgi:hypothetical protein